MSYKLPLLRQAIESFLSDSISATGDEDTAGEVLKQCGEILSSLLIDIPLMPTEQGQICIRQHQYFISLMLDKMNPPENRDETATGKKNWAVADRIKHSLNSLLDDLELYFPSFFDYSTNIPRSRFERYQITLLQRIEGMIEVLVGKGVENEIPEMLSSLSLQLLDHKTTISYYQVCYLLDFFNTLSTIFNQDMNKPGTLDILLTMASFGFNHPYFYHFCCSYFNRELEKCGNLTDRYSLLNFLDKTLHQLTPPSGDSYNQKLAPIRDSLSRYVLAELGYLKSLESTATDLQGEGFQQGSFRVGFTVRQLAFFVRLQVESEIIIAQSPKTLHRYVTRHYSTVEKENISEKSFKNAYYSAMGNDVEKVIEKIAAMLAIAQEKY